MPSNSSFNNRQKQDTIVEITPIEDTSIEPKATFSFTNQQLELMLGRLLEFHSSRSPVCTCASTPIGNPGPLGLAAFALTTFMLSVFNAGSNLIDAGLEEVVLPVALFYGGLAQFAAGMWEYRVNNTFGATAFATYGGFWMSFAGYIYLIVPKIEAVNKTKQASGLFLLSWFIFTLYMNVASWRVSKAIFSVFFGLNFTFLFLIIGLLGNAPVITNIGGWVGIVTAGLAWYTSGATIINTTFKKSVLPLGVYKPKEKASSIVITHF
ncbi:unnamed protein product [Rotaria magnacalcarata]|uniref:Uncharacterized protein n=1 Tax=Rotaria magnacalcarata TaxID=392030 RepID=A0A817AAK8_9BILA|nr:unnamed protein product [Rotaria magnacalcarata]CAF1669941.1 unnamed protein product [Rotaria magnacalcarata]CAF1946939.1 unnamed protein product [Rotaria magnacalcarata]CAF2135963.1 unnamed protein product [Rotaria magnacalcarata]CAF2261498.1 unnamed protein product [Rotaria magnacalcarata]